jgi:hypothetical protein
MFLQVGGTTVLCDRDGASKKLEQEIKFLDSVQHPSLLLFMGAFTNSDLHGDLRLLCEHYRLSKEEEVVSGRHQGSKP